MSNIIFIIFFFPEEENFCKFCFLLQNFVFWNIDIHGPSLERRMSKGTIGSVTPSSYLAIKAKLRDPSISTSESFQFGCLDGKHAHALPLSRKGENLHVPDCTLSLHAYNYLIVRLGNQKVTQSVAIFAFPFENVTCRRSCPHLSLIFCKRRYEF